MCVAMATSAAVAESRLEVTRSESQELIQTSRSVQMPSSVAVTVDSAGVAGKPTTLVSLRMKEAAPAEVFAELSRQMGVSFRPPMADFWKHYPLKKLSVDAQRQPGWLVALQVADACGLQYVPGPGNTVQISMRGWPVTPKPTSAFGPLVMQVDAVRHDKTVNLGAPEARRSPLQLVMSVYTDPSLKSYRFLGQPQVEQATDSEGASLAPEKVDASKVLAPEPGTISQQVVELVYPETPGKTIALVRGSVTMLVASQIQDWVIENPAAASGASRKLGKYTCTFTSLTRKDQGYELKLQVKGPANGGFRSPVQDLVVGEGSILPVDAAGNRWRISEVSGHYDAREMTAVGHFDYTITLAPEEAGKAGAITRLTWRLPQELSNVEVPFEFRDLPMP